MNSFSDLLAFAHSLADDARAVTLPLFRQGGHQFQAKSDHSPVGAADRDGEKFLRERIGKQFPQHAIIGEEFGGDTHGDFVWILDPIDGTRSFISGSPLFCTLIGLLYRNKPVLGVIDMPALNERWSGCIADSSAEAWFCDSHCRVSDCTALNDAVLATTTLHISDSPHNAALLQLCRQVGQVRLGGDASAFGCLASGFLDIAADYEMAAHDYLPLVPIIEGAGGMITDFQGNALNFLSASQDKVSVLATATPQLHQQALDALGV